MNGVTDVIHQVAADMGIGLEKLFQSAAHQSKFTNYLEVGSYRFQQFLHEGEIPPYVMQFCLQQQPHETVAEEGGLIHASAD